MTWSLTINIGSGLIIKIDWLILVYHFYVPISFAGMSHWNIYHGKRKSDWQWQPGDGYKLSHIVPDSTSQWRCDMFTTVIDIDQSTHEMLQGLHIWKHFKTNTHTKRE